MFPFEPHGPQMNQRPKTLDQFRVMFNVMVFWSEIKVWKHSFKNLSVITYFGLQVLKGFLCERRR